MKEKSFTTAASMYSEADAGHTTSPTRAAAATGLRARTPRRWRCGGGERGVKEVSGGVATYNGGKDQWTPLALAIAIAVVRAHARASVSTCEVVWTCGRVNV